MMQKEEVVVCIGDIHGQLAKLKNLWTNLESHLQGAFNTATIVFLGDLVDRGPNSKQTLDWLINLKHNHPTQKHIFLAGNHDFAFASFLGVLPTGSGEEYRNTWENAPPSEIRAGEEKSWYDGEGYETMHLQGRRWGGTFLKNDSLYHSKRTFESYGVEFANRTQLLKAVSEEQKQFLRDMPWVFDTQLTNGLRVIAVHAGLRFDQPINDQIEYLKRRDCSIGRVSQLCDRDVVKNTPPDMFDLSNVILVSGHFFQVILDDKRCIVDSGGGFDHKPISCLILPSRTIISSDS